MMALASDSAIALVAPSRVVGTIGVCLAGCVVELEELDEQAVVDKTSATMHIHGLALNIIRGYMNVMSRMNSHFR